MALIKCPDCKQVVSTSATQCPKCGCLISTKVVANAERVDKDGLPVGTMKIIGILIAVVIVLGLLFGGNHKCSLCGNMTNKQLGGSYVCYSCQKAMGYMK